MLLRVAWILRLEAGNFGHQEVVMPVRALCLRLCFCLCAVGMKKDCSVSCVFRCTFVGGKTKPKPKRGGDEMRKWRGKSNGVLCSGICGRVVPVNSRKILQR